VSDIGSERLQKLMAKAGVGSRRYCEILIERGRVSVNGVLVRELGTRASFSDEIRVDGVLLAFVPERVSLVFNKPAGVVSTMSDDLGRTCLADFLPSDMPRLFHVGRLDEQTEGLIILTNDGDLAQKLAHPRYEVSKRYTALVEGVVSRGTLKALRGGIELEDGPIAVDSISLRQASSDSSLIELSLHSGRNRIVRRMMAAVGHPVEHLVRTHIGHLGLDGLKPGAMRELSEAEIQTFSRDLNW